MAMQKPADLARHLLPCILHATILKLKEEGKSSPFGWKTRLYEIKSGKITLSPQQVNYSQTEIQKTKDIKISTKKNEMQPEMLMEKKNQKLHE